MDIAISLDVPSFARLCCERVVHAAEAAIGARGRFVVGLTGGSTPDPIHRALAEPPFRDAIRWRDVVVIFGDERAVPPDDPRSNFAAAHAALLSRVPIPEARILRMRGEARDLVDEARRYADAFEREAGGAVDLLFVGVGKDAHVLSLFPGSPAIDDMRALVVAEIDPPMDPPISRITFTPAIFGRARAILAIATGGSKAEAVQRVLEDHEQPRDCPARLLATAPNVTWALDRPAARLLSPR
jgi:6-phosphogluconolactonase